MKGERKASSTREEVRKQEGFSPTVSVFRLFPLLRKIHAKNRKERTLL